jgi:3D (Asp-Asp-Asp) domain-containing protein
MTTAGKFLILSSLAVFAAGCATQPPLTTATSARPHGKRVAKVRTTAYTHTEGSGGRNAIGKRLSGGKVRSAAADWSRWPLGTKFRIVDTDEVFQIDDYGSALVGTNTIDLYKTNRLAMNKWGVRSVDIDVIEWGSTEKSLAVLAPRAHTRCVHEMIVSLSKKAAGRENTHLSPAFF